MTRSTFTVALLAFLAVSALAQDYSLPDLGLNSDEITCDNYEQLLDVAFEDKSRIQELTVALPDLTDELENQVSDDVSQMCENAAKIKPLPELQSLEGGEDFSEPALFFQTSTSTTSKLLKQSMSVFATTNPVNTIFQQVVQDRLLDVFQSLEQIMQKSATGAPVQDSDCQPVRDAVTDLIAYLNWAETELRETVLAVTLHNRIQALEAKETECNEPSGNFFSQGQQEFDLSGEKVSKGSGFRFTSVTIDFGTTLDAIPSVAFAIRSYEYSKNPLSIHLFKESISHHSAQVKILVQGSIRL